jgi:hypothetical protein
MNKGVKRLAILLGGLGALWATHLFALPIASALFAESIAQSGWLIGLSVLAVALVWFLIPFCLVHAIAWVVRGFKQ